MSDGIDLGMFTAQQAAALAGSDAKPDGQPMRYVECASPNQQRALMSVVDERRYQKQKWPGHTHTLGEWILIMRKCLNDAEAAWYAGHGDQDKVRSEICQVAAVGVAALEEHGAPPYRHG